MSGQQVHKIGAGRKPTFVGFIV